MGAEKANHPVAVMARVLGVSTSGFYDWKAKGGKPSARAARDQELTKTIRRIHADSRNTYGAPRVHMELRLGRQERIGRKRVARLMRLAGLVGAHQRRRVGTHPTGSGGHPQPRSGASPVQRGCPGRLVGHRYLRAPHR